MLKDELDKRGIKVCEFARMTGLDRTTISRICHNRKRVTMFTFRKIRDALGMSEAEALKLIGCDVWMQNEHEWKEAIYSKGMNVSEFCEKFNFPRDTLFGIFSKNKHPQRYTKEWVERCLNEL